MTNRFINATDAFASPFYTQVVETAAGARLLTVSGQVGLDPDGTLADGFEAQTRLAFQNLDKQLAAGGMSLKDVVKMTVILTEHANVAAFREIRNGILGELRPASTMIIAGLADPRWLVEIEAVAAQ